MPTGERGREDLRRAEAAEAASVCSASLVARVPPGKTRDRRLLPFGLSPIHCLGSDTVKFSELDSFLPSSFQMAPSASESVVTGNTTFRSPLLPGRTSVSRSRLVSWPPCPRRPWDAVRPQHLASQLELLAECRWKLNSFLVGAPADADGTTLRRGVPPVHRGYGEGYSAVISSQLDFLPSPAEFTAATR